MMEKSTRKGQQKLGQDTEHQEGLSGINHPGINGVHFWLVSIVLCVHFSNNFVFVSFSFVATTGY